MTPLGESSPEWALGAWCCRLRPLVAWQPRHAGAPHWRTAPRNGRSSHCHKGTWHCLAVYTSARSADALIQTDDWPALRCYWPCRCPANCWRSPSHAPPRPCHCCAVSMCIHTCATRPPKSNISYAKSEASASLPPAAGKIRLADFVFRGGATVLQKATSGWPSFFRLWPWRPRPREAQAAKGWPLNGQPNSASL